MKITYSFLCVLICCFFCLFSMEKSSSGISAVDSEVQRIVDMINQYHLNYQDNWAIARHFYNFCDAISLTEQQVEGEMDLIESYISEGVDKECVLQKLAQEHWYIDYLMTVLVKKKITEFNEVTGSTIDSLYGNMADALYHCTDKSSIKNLIYQHVLDHFFHELDTIDISLFDEVSEESQSIYFTILKGYDQIKSSSLSISTDGRYIRATDYNKKHIIWDTTSGGTVTSAVDTRSQNIDWIVSKRDKKFLGFDDEEKKYSVATQNYYAMVKKLRILDSRGQFFSGPEYKSKVIILCKRPEPILYWYQKAFDNSKDNLAELVALRNSKNLADIKGFPQNNIKQLIAKHINKLNLTVDWQYVGLTRPYYLIK